MALLKFSLFQNESSRQNKPKTESRELILVGPPTIDHAGNGNRHSRRKRKSKLPPETEVAPKLASGKTVTSHSQSDPRIYLRGSTHSVKRMRIAHSSSFKSSSSTAAKFVKEIQRLQFYPWFYLSKPNFSRIIDRF